MAEGTALATLMSMLSPEQRKGYNNGSFEMVGSEGTEISFDTLNWQGNIYANPKYQGEGAHYWCAHIGLIGHFQESIRETLVFSYRSGLCGEEFDRIIENDGSLQEFKAKHHLAQYLLLLTDEKKFFEVAL